MGGAPNQGGTSGLDGDGGAVGGCHTNADCTLGNVCFIASVISDCATAPVGVCTPILDMGNCELSGLHGPCGCLTDLATIGQCASAGLACSGATRGAFDSSGRAIDYSARGCFGCVPTNGAPW